MYKNKFYFIKYINECIKMKLYLISIMIKINVLCNITVIMFITVSNRIEKKPIKIKHAYILLFYEFYH